MSFQQGLSGLGASSRSLDVIGNNIANASTVGAKSSRAEFSGIYASSLGSSAASSPGIGVTVTTIAQQFSQGNIETTNNPLDVAINGNGFFQLNLPNGTRAYTRDGQFQLDASGNLVTATGAQVLGLSPDPSTGAILAGGTVGPIAVPTAKGIPAIATAAISVQANLNATAAVNNGGNPDATPSTLQPPLATYGTSLTAYDGQGDPVTVSVYFTKTATNTWQVWTNDLSGANGPPVQLGGNLQFNPSTGAIAANSPWLTPVTLPITTANGAITPAPKIDLSQITQYGSAFAVNAETQNGQPPGALTGVSIDSAGVITGTYSNGKQIPAGQIQLATFVNTQGLSPVGSGNWMSTSQSGTPVVGAPGVGNIGSVQSGAVEDSNVDLTQELVNMMTAQRDYQANAQSIKTEDQIMQTLVNLR